MTGRELSDKLNYLGMERKIRKLALEEKNGNSGKNCSNVNNGSLQSGFERV